MNRVKQWLTLVFLIAFLPNCFFACAHKEVIETTASGAETWKLQLTGQTEGTLELILERAKIEGDSCSVTGKFSGPAVDYHGGAGELRCKLEGTIERNKILADFSGTFTGSEPGTVFITGTMRGTISESQGSGTWSIKHALGSSAGEWAITKIAPSQ